MTKSKMLVDSEWMRRNLPNDPDIAQEAGTAKTERAKPAASDLEIARTLLAYPRGYLSHHEADRLMKVAAALAEARQAPPENPTPEMIERGLRVALGSWCLNASRIHDIWQAMYDEWQASFK